MQRYLKIIKWRANKQLKQQHASWQVQAKRIFKRGQAIWFNLSTAQKLYLLALASLVVLQSGWLCTALSIIALIVEFWPKFNHLWHSLAGKALILIFYATIANFVLASASGIVNEVTMVSASQLNYTHNFATLIYLPPWALGITLATLLALQLLLPLYILALLLIKPFGSDRIKFITQSYSPLLTALLRFVLASVVILNIFSFVDGKPTTEVIDDITTTFSQSQQLSTKPKAQQEQAIEQISEKIQQQTESEQETDKQPLITLDATSEGDTDISNAVYSFLDTKGYFERSKRLIAIFAYSFEANSYSRCKKSTNTKVVELNDYEIVEIALDNSKPYGYSFTVKACDSAGIKAPQ
ncbi:hypothetical protein CWB85_05085 [Pseudoalteromonas sp. S1727]|uniref:hypothetical protein n=1 Tax=Pseudoalteromonas sp. S1727 TaxID=2066514 RepID=UPI001107F359|nr:hypothetical protein [Pseudoalteromonas sp. S1727]TMN73057.1 hypothetical protein CWB85_05085 [Pseudoalteromonas sp. S1727]